MNLAYTGKQPNSESDEWYTPAEFVERARIVLETIDLDPFSCGAANRVVKATKFFSKDECAYSHPWREGRDRVRVFMNPPYGRATLAPAVSLFLQKWHEGHVLEAIVLVNNATETKWFQSLAVNCNAICFAAKKISFWNADGKPISGNTRGQVFFYFGDSEENFIEEFSPVGIVTIPILF
jgi:DNA N-6-adenine-methyltransferase (Dam)